MKELICAIGICVSDPLSSGFVCQAQLELKLTQNGMWLLSLFCTRGVDLQKGCNCKLSVNA